MDKTLMSTAYACLVSLIAQERSTAPNPETQGTALSFAGSAAGFTAATPTAHTALVAVLGARVIDLPGLVPRGAPV